MSARIVIASGGTGGHMFPAVALGDVLRARGHEVAYAVDARGERYLPAEAPHFRILSASPTGTTFQRLMNMAALGSGLAQALAAFVRHRPQAVVAFGGYASVPPGLAAAMLRIPLVLHEQNAVFGRAHRLLRNSARVVALSFASTRNAPPAGERVRVAGNPVRAEFHAAAAPAAAADAVFHVFVVGGSQGATALSEIVPAAVTRLEGAAARLRVVQQCRPEDVERVRTVYADAGIDAEVAAFFADMPARLAAADLVVSRAGASAVAELLVMGRPAILVAYPHAAEDHQRANAHALAAAGAAVAIDPAEFTVDRLAAELERLLAAPSALAAMTEATRALAKPDAAERLADIVEEVLR